MKVIKRFNRTASWFVAVPLLCSLLALVSCDAGSPASVSAGSSIGPQFNVQTADGSATTIQADANTDIVFMATWCHYSKQLKDVLNDPGVKPYAARRKILFVFGNEWPKIEKELKDLAKSGEFPPSEIQSKLSKLKKRSGAPYVFDPKFLSDIPGPVYFISPYPQSVDGFPSVITRKGTENRLPWLLNFGIPQQTALNIWDAHNPDNDQ